MEYNIQMHIYDEWQEYFHIEYIQIFFMIILTMCLMVPEPMLTKIT